MRWWILVGFLLLIVVGILLILKFRKKTEEGFQTSSTMVGNSVFDRSYGDISGTYTILDLDALYVQRNIMILDAGILLDNKKKIEDTQYKGAYNDFVTATTNTNSTSKYELYVKDFGSHPTKDDLYLNYMRGVSREIKQYLLFKYSQGAITERIAEEERTRHALGFNGLTSFTAYFPQKTSFNDFLLHRKDSIRAFHKSLQDKLAMHPIGFIINGMLDKPVSLNTFSINYVDTLHKDPDYDAVLTYHYASGVQRNTPQLNPSNGKQPLFSYFLYPSYGIDKKPHLLKRQICSGPFGSSDNTKMFMSYKQLGGFNFAWTNEVHDPGGEWCVHYYPQLFECCDSFGKMGWGGANCFREWPSLYTELNKDDIVMNEERITTGTMYSTKFLSSTDDWDPTIKNFSSTVADKLIESLNIVKDALKNKYKLSSKPYRWKPISYFGSLSPTNLTEIKESILLSCYFNLSNPELGENQFRIDHDDLKFYYSKTCSAKPTFKTIIIPEDNDNKKARSMSIVVDNDNVANNRINCNHKMTIAEMNLLPYHTRKILSIWATLRKTRMIGGLDGWTPTNRNDASGNYLSDTDNQNVYNLSSSSLITGCTIDTRNKLLNSVAQLFYQKNEGKTRIRAILDIFQVGTSVFDIRYEERKIGLSTRYSDEITALNVKYAEYRRYNLSELELNKLDSDYQTKIDNLYKLQDTSIYGNAYSCGLRDPATNKDKKARYVKITCGTGSTFNLSQIIVIDNTGQNVALYARTVASDKSIQLESFEDATGTIYTNIATGSAYSTAESAVIAEKENAQVGLTKLEILTDGTYAQRIFPTYKSNGLVPNQYIVVDLARNVDISTVIILHSPDTKVMEFTMSLLDANQVEITGSFVTFQTNPTATVNPASRTGTITPSYSTEKGSGKVLIDYRVDSDGTRSEKNQPACPTDIYSFYSVARFYADIKTSATNGYIPYVKSGEVSATSYVKFTGFSIGPEAALTFNPMYNAGLIVDTTSSFGNIGYLPIITYTMNVPAELRACDDPLRIYDVFKDYSRYFNDNMFISRADVVNGGFYNSNNTYIPFQATQFKNLSNPASNNTVCAYSWTEKVYDENNVLTETVTRYGKFVYFPDTQNWQSQATVYDISSSRMYISLDALKLDNNISSLSTISTPVDIPIPYKDSVTLDTLGGMCPIRDCSDPAVINSIIWSYNKNIDRYKTTLNGTNAINDMGAIIRVTKAVTISSKSCEYEVQTANSPGLTKIQVLVAVTPNATGDCDYTIVKGSVPSSNITSLTNETPYLTRVFHFAKDTMKPFIKAFRGVYNDLSGLLQFQTNETGDGIKSKLKEYRTVTNTAGGVMRTTATLNTEKNAMGLDCSGVSCTSQTIVDSFIKIYNSNNPTRLITEILEIGMDASTRACDFTFTTAPIVATTVATGLSLGVDRTRGQTSGLKAKIKRYSDDTCSYVVDTSSSPTGINPIAPMSHIADVVRKDYIHIYQYLKFSVYSVVNTKDNTPLSITGFELQRDGIPVAWNTNATTTPLAANTIFNNIAENKPVIDWTGGRTPTQSNPSYIIIDNTKDLFFTSYAWGMNNSENNDAEPARWKLEGSTNGTTWTTIDDKSQFSQYFIHDKLQYIKTIYPPPVDKGTQITSAGIKYDPNVTGATGPTGSIRNDVALYTLIPPAGPTGAIGVTNGFNGPAGPLESIDYINCNSKYAMNLMYSSGTITSVANIDSLNCYAGSATNGNKYTFSKGPGTMTIGPISNMTAPPNKVAVSISSKPALTSPSNLTDALCATVEYTSITGLTIKESKRVPTIANMCEYRLSDDPTIPFEDNYKRVQFYTGTLQAPNDGSVHVASISSSSPITTPYSPYILFSTLPPNINTDITTMATYLFKNWNSKFNDDSFDKTGWKIGVISKIGILLLDDIVIFEATATKFGIYGENDIRDSAPNGSTSPSPALHYFKFTLRRDLQTNTNTNTFNSTKYIIFKKEDSSTSYGSYRKDYSIDTTTNTTIHTNSGLSSSVFTIKTYTTAVNNGPYRQVRFKVTRTPASIHSDPINTRAAEITRLLFYNTDNKNPSKPQYTFINLPKATVTVQDVYSNYLLGQYDRPTCDQNYTTRDDPVRGRICEYNRPPATTTKKGSLCNSYSSATDLSGYFAGKTSETTCYSRYSYDITDNYSIMGSTVKSFTKGVACGIGYQRSDIKNATGTSTIAYKCDLRGFFYDVIKDPVTILNLGPSLPRLNLDINQYVTVDFGDYISMTGFSFITGSNSKVPLQWVLEGSVNGIDWVSIHSQTSDYNYSSSTPGHTAASPSTSNSSVLIRNIFHPGVFPILSNTIIADSSTTIASDTNTTTNYSRTLSENITEGFSANLLKPEMPIETMKLVSPPANLEPSYALPLHTDRNSNFNSNFNSNSIVHTQIVQKRRIQQLRFRILETHDPTSKFAHMSKLEFHTRNGIIPPSCFKLSNPQGSRKNPKEGVNGLLGTQSDRWVDFNKAEILVQFDVEILPGIPITGFKFFVPDVPGAVGAFPCKWILLGSYDKREWVPLHEQTEQKARLVGLTTPVYKLYEEI